MARWICAALVGLALGARATPSLADPADAIDASTADLRLADHHARELRIGDRTGEKLTVIAFLGADCPLAKTYAPRLGDLAREFEPQGVRFLGIDANVQDSLTDIERFAQNHKLPFPLLKDRDGALADRLGATRTPEVFVVDGEWKVRYAGRIDDQFGLTTGAGYARPKLSRRDLAEALTDLLAGREPAVARTVASGCVIGRRSEVEPHGDVTFTNQVARILQKRCESCHREGEVAPFALKDYDEVVGWAGMIREVVSEGRMPPWTANPRFGHFANDARLSDEEKQTLFTWIDNGCPQGDPAELPAPRTYAEGWGVGEPDAVYYISEHGYDVPADGVVDYQYFEVDPGFTEDKWVQWAEAKPDARPVVHHIVCFVVPPGARRGGGIGGELRPDGLISVYAPGTSPWAYPAGTAFFVPAGGKLRFQMHYTPNGTAMKDRSCVGFKFANPADVRARARSGFTANFGLEIPAGADDHAVDSRYRFRKDSTLVSLFPHMHLRGKSFRYEAEYPDGTREVLLDVPRYDFNWQLRYDLAEPKPMPKGTRLYCTSTYDNSADNPANPDPTQTVRWGDQTWEEMHVGFFTVVADMEDESPREARRRAGAEQAGG